MDFQKTFPRKKKTFPRKQSNPAISGHPEPPPGNQLEIFLQFQEIFERFGTIRFFVRLGRFLISYQSNQSPASNIRKLFELYLFDKMYDYGQLMMDFVKKIQSLQYFIQCTHLCIWVMYTKYTSMQFYTYMQFFQYSE